jgi:hypothetical protein
MNYRAIKIFLESKSKYICHIFSPTCRTYRALSVITMLKLLTLIENFSPIPVIAMKKNSRSYKALFRQKAIFLNSLYLLKTTVSLLIYA